MSWKSALVVHISRNNDTNDGRGKKKSQINHRRVVNGLAIVFVVHFNPFYKEVFEILHGR